MKKLLSTRYSAGSVNTGMLFLRISLGLLMMVHGYQKLVNFNEMKSTFMNFLGLGSLVSLCLVIFAEFFCSILITVGLFTRLAAIPLIITMLVALFMAHNHDFTGKGEMATIYLSGYVAILFIGPGKISFDGAMGK